MCCKFELWIKSWSGKKHNTFNCAKQAHINKSDAYSPSASEWRLLISYICIIRTCWMYRRHLISNALQPLLQPSGFRLPSVPFHHSSHLLTDYRKTGRAPKSSSKAIEYAFLNFDLDAGRILSVLVLT